MKNKKAICVMVERKEVFGIGRQDDERRKNLEIFYLSTYVVYIFIISIIHNIITARVLCSSS